MTKLILLLLPLFLFAWEEFKDLDQIKIYKKHEERFKFVQFKAETKLSFSVSRISDTIMDHSTYTSWLANCIKAESRGGNTYLLMQPPWPLKKRQVWTRVAKKEYAHKQIITLRSLETKTASEDAVWFNYLYGEFLLEEINSKETKLTLSQLGDPGGSVPHWLVNLMAWTIPHETLLNLKSYLQQH